MKHLLTRAACLLLLLLSLPPAVDAATAVIGTDDAMLPLNGWLEYRRDDSADLSFDGIRKQERAGSSRFIAATPTLLNPGYSKAAHWLRVSIENRSDQTLERWLVLSHARLQQVTLFVADHDGHVTRIETGARLRFGERPLAEEQPALPLQIRARQMQTIYLRIASETNIRIDATLWEPMTFRASQDQLHKRSFLLFGALGMVVLSGLILFFSLRQPALLYQSLAVFSYLVFESGFAGYSLRHLWPDAPAWDLRIVGAASPLTSSFELLYLRVFLQSRTLMPRIDLLMRLMIVGECLAATMMLVGDYRLGVLLSQPFLLSAALISPIAAGLAWRIGLPGARFILLAMLTLWMIVIIRVLIGYGLLPNSDSFVDATPWAVLIATTLMLWAVTDRVALLQRKNAALDAFNRHQLEEQVTERTDTLRLALQAANAANRAKDDFLAHVSHDLRAPLTTILGYTSVLATDAQTAPRLEHKAIERSARHLLSLIDDLIHAAKGDSAPQVLMNNSVSLHQFTSDIGEHAEMLAQKHGNHFELILTGDLPAAIAVDDKRLRQVLLNLLDNACKFTENGYITLTLNGALSPPEEATSARLSFAVADTGIGIPDAEQQRIFEPFHQVGTERWSQHGIGLGLAIAAEWVRRMGGEIEVESAPGQGAEFLFCIDCAVVGATSPRLRRPHRISPDGTTAPHKALLADDDEPFRTALQQAFEHAGFEVIVVANGAAAIAAEAEGSFDLIVTDQIMPQANGWEVLRAIAARHLSGTGPVVVLVSSTPPRQPADWPADLGFGASFLKPFDADVMLARVAELL